MAARYEHSFGVETSWPKSSGHRFISSCPLENLHICTVTLAEIRFGIESAPDPMRRTEIQRWLADTVRPMFAGRVLDVTEDVMLRWRMLVETGRKAGRTLPQPDLIIAAIAIEHDLVVVTRNTKDFAGLGITVFNPWND